MAKMVVWSASSRFSPHFRNMALRDLRRSVPWARNSGFKALDGIIAIPSRNKSRMYGQMEDEKIDRTILQKTSGLYEIKLLRQHDSRGQVPLVGNGDKQLGYISLGEHRRKWSRERDMRCAANVFQCFNDP